jgi:hypothetical protein
MLLCNHVMCVRNGLFSMFYLRKSDSVIDSKYGGTLCSIMYTWSDLLPKALPVS